MSPIFGGRAGGIGLILCMVSLSGAEVPKQESIEVDARELTIEGRAWPGEGRIQGEILWSINTWKNTAVHDAIRCLEHDLAAGARRLVAGVDDLLQIEQLARVLHIPGLVGAEFGDQGGVLGAGAF